MTPRDAFHDEDAGRADDAGTVPDAAIPDAGASNPASIDHLLVQNLDYLGYLLVGVAFVSTGKAICYRMQECGRFGDQETLPYDDVLKRVLSHTADEVREELAPHAALPSLVQRLNKDGGISHTFTATIDGEKRHLLAQFGFLDDVKDTILFSVTDVTDVHEAARAGRAKFAREHEQNVRTNALLQSILDTVSTAIFWKDADRRFEGANQRFLDYYGFSSLDDILGKNDEDMGWHPDPGPFKDDELAVINEGASTYRVPGVNQLGDATRHIVASKRPRYVDGQVVGLVGCFEDVTAEVERMHEVQQLNERLATALDAAERSSAAEQVFLSNVSHDMRTPLNGILGFSRLARQTDDPALLHDYIDRIDLAGHLMLDLVNDVLDMSKIQSGKLELHPAAVSTHKLYQTIVSSIQVMADEKSLSFEAHLDGDYPTAILADRLRLQQIAMNLLSNAVKYTPEGGHVTFAVQAATHDGGTTRPTTLVIQDDGIGMSEDFQQRMFEPFSQEHQAGTGNTQGTGLGLSIVKRIVELMGGTIQVRSALGEGTRIEVHLPVEVVEAPDVAAAPAGDAPGLVQETPASEDIRGRNILLCEDNQLNAEIACAILAEGSGANVTRAADGAEGLQAFEDSPVGHFDLILMDLRMPNMDGIEATHAIRALDRPDATTVPIVAMTADAFAEDAQRCLDAGMNGHVAKPIDVARLLHVIARLT